MFARREKRQKRADLPLKKENATQSLGARCERGRSESESEVYRGVVEKKKKASKKDQLVERVSGKSKTELFPAER